MEASFWAAQILGLIGFGSSAIAMQINERNKILTFHIIANIFYVISFYMLGAYTGALICLVSVIETYINNSFYNKAKDVPYWLLIVYSIISILIGVFSFGNVMDAIPIICSFLFIGVITVSKESGIRLLTLIEMILWIVYDVYVRSYLPAATDLIVVISTIVGIYRFDYRAKKRIK